MNKLNKVFKKGDILKAEDINNITDKIKEAAAVKSVSVNIQSAIKNTKLPYNFMNNVVSELNKVRNKVNMSELKLKFTYLQTLYASDLNKLTVSIDDLVDHLNSQSGQPDAPSTGSKNPLIGKRYGVDQYTPWSPFGDLHEWVDYVLTANGSTVAPFNVGANSEFEVGSYFRPQDPTVIDSNNLENNILDYEKVSQFMGYYDAGIESNGYIAPVFAYIQGRIRACESGQKHMDPNGDWVILTEDDNSVYYRSFYNDSDLTRTIYVNSEATEFNNVAEYCNTCPQSHSLQYFETCEFKFIEWKEVNGVRKPVFDININHGDPLFKPLWAKDFAICENDKYNSCKTFPTFNGKPITPENTYAGVPSSYYEVTVNGVKGVLDGNCFMPTPKYRSNGKLFNYIDNPVSGWDKASDGSEIIPNNGKHNMGIPGPLRMMYRGIVDNKYEGPKIANLKCVVFDFLHPNGFICNSNGVDWNNISQYQNGQKYNLGKTLTFTKKDCPLTLTMKSYQSDFTYEASAEDVKLQKYTGSNTSVQSGLRNNTNAVRVGVGINGKNVDIISAYFEHTGATGYVHTKDTLPDTYLGFAASNPSTSNEKGHIDTFGYKYSSVLSSDTNSSIVSRTPISDVVLSHYTPQNGDMLYNRITIYYRETGNPQSTPSQGENPAIGKIYGVDEFTPWSELGELHEWKDYVLDSMNNPVATCNIGANNPWETGYLFIQNEPNNPFTVEQFTTVRNKRKQNHNGSTDIMPYPIGDVPISDYDFSKYPSFAGFINGWPIMNYQMVTHLYKLGSSGGMYTIMESNNFTNSIYVDGHKTTYKHLGELWDEVYGSVSFGSVPFNAEVRALKNANGRYVYTSDNNVKIDINVYSINNIYDYNIKFDKTHPSVVITPSGILEDSTEDWGKEFRLEYPNLKDPVTDKYLSKADSNLFGSYWSPLTYPWKEAYDHGVKGWRDNYVFFPEVQNPSGLDNTTALKGIGSNLSTNPIVHCEDGLTNGYVSFMSCGPIRPMWKGRRDVKYTGPKFKNLKCAVFDFEDFNTYKDFPQVTTGTTSVDLTKELTFTKQNGFKLQLKSFGTSFRYVNGGGSSYGEGRRLELDNSTRYHLGIDLNDKYIVEICFDDFSAHALPDYFIESMDPQTSMIPRYPEVGSVTTFGYCCSMVRDLYQFDYKNLGNPATWNLYDEFVSTHKAYLRREAHSGIKQEFHRIFVYYLDYDPNTVEYHTLKISKSNGVIDSEESSVTKNTLSNSGEYVQNHFMDCETIKVTASHEMMQFKQWSDGNTNNPRTFVMNNDYDVRPIFK